MKVILMVTCHGAPVWGTQSGVVPRVEATTHSPCWSLKDTLGGTGNQEQADTRNPVW